jgi:hypothetical protein
MDLLQLIGVNIDMITSNPIVASLIRGAVDGIVVGLITGALVWSITKAPDVLGRALLIAVIIGIVGFIAEFVRIGAVMGFGMGEMIASLNDNPEIGPMFLRAVVRTFYYMLFGASVGIGMRAPQYLLKGAVIGVLLGGLIGALIWFVLSYFWGLVLNIVLFRFFVVLGVTGTITGFANR